MKTLSIIIPTANDFERLTLSLSSLFHQSVDQRQIEILVIQKPDIHFPKKLVEFFSTLNIRWLTQKKRSRAEARNLGIKKASGDIILFLDDDLVCDRNFLCHHLLNHENFEGIVLGQVKNVYFSRLGDKLHDSLECPLDSNIFSKNLEIIQNKSRTHPYFNLTRLPFHWEKNNIPWIGFGTNNASLLRKYLSGGFYFCEEYEGWGLDNLELGLKLCQQGLKYVYDSKCVNYHLSHPRDKERHQYEFLKNFKIFTKRNPSEITKPFWEYLSGEISLEKFNWLMGSHSNNYLSEKEHFYPEYKNLKQWIDYEKRYT